MVRKNSAKLIYSILIVVGTMSLTIATIYASSVLAFTGLGLIFWGIVLAYIRSEEYIKKAVLTAAISAQTAMLSEVIQGMKYEGNAIYLPPKYFKDTEDNKAYISKQKEANLLPITKMGIQNPQGLLLTPSGAGLSKLFEKTLKIDFAKVDLQYLKQNMSRLLVKELEILRNFEIKTENNMVRVEIEDSVFDVPDTETEQTSPLNSALGFPLSSAIACAIAKTTGKLVIIEKQLYSEHGRDMNIEYRILEEEQ